jgi:hypothetical protein
MDSTSPGWSDALSTETRFQERTLVWRLRDGSTVEHCSVVRLHPVGHEPIRRYIGYIVGIEDDQPLLITYVVELQELTGRLSCSVQSQVGAGRRHVGTLIRQPDGKWLIRSPTEPRFPPAPDLDAASELDLEFTPLTNTLAINRLNLAVGESADLITAWVRFPRLTVEPYPQRYTRLAERTYRFESEGFSAEIEVDDLNLVVRYGDLWERIAVDDSDPGR